MTTPVAADEYYLGNLTDNKNFSLAGEVWVVSDRVVEIRHFNYEGKAPDPFRWADPTPEGPTNANGFILQDTFPTATCGTKIIPNMTAYAFAKDPTYRVEFPEGTSIHDVFNGTISLWCRAMYVNLGSVKVPDSMDNLPDTDEKDLLCDGVETDRFNLYDRLVKPVSYLLGGLWEDVTHFWSQSEVLVSEETEEQEEKEDHNLEEDPDLEDGLDLLAETARSGHLLI